MDVSLTTQQRLQALRALRSELGDAEFERKVATFGEVDLIWWAVAEDLIGPPVGVTVPASVVRQRALRAACEGLGQATYERLREALGEDELLRQYKADHPTAPSRPAPDVTPTVDQSVRLKFLAWGREAGYLMLLMLVFAVVTVASYRQRSVGLWFLGGLVGTGVLSSLVVPWDDTVRTKPGMDFRFGALLVVSTCFALWLFPHAFVWSYTEHAPPHLLLGSRFAGLFFALGVGPAWPALSVLLASVLAKAAMDGWRIALTACCGLVLVACFWHATVYVVVGTGLWFQWLFSHF